jgi:hypothetical protein
MQLSKFKLILPTLGDFANGIFAISFSAWIFQVDLVWWYFVVAFMIALLPDLDALPEVLLHGQVGKKQEHSNLAKNHRTYLHYPAVFVVIGLFIFKLSEFWGVTFLVAITLHFVRDILGTGWGLKVLWPVSDKNYKLFSRGNETMKIAHVLTDAEIVLEAEQHGNDNWLEETYLQFSWIGTIEYTLFVISLGIMCRHLVY